MQPTLLQAAALLTLGSFQFLGQATTPGLPDARALVAAGKLGDAEQVVRSYLAANSQSAEGHYLLGYILFREQKPKDSLSEYTLGAKYRTPSAADLETVASDYVLLKDYPDADKWFTKAVDWTPGDAHAWYYLGRTKYNENRFEEAISAFQHCLKLEPRNVKAEDNLGLSFEGLNRIDDAMAAYRSAIAWQADALAKDPGPFLNLGTLLSDNGSPQEALPSLKQAEEIATGDYRVHRQLGKTLTRLNRLEEARAELEQAVALAPGNAPLHFMLAQAYRKLGMLDKAKAENERYTALAGTSSQ